jgi:hypothetical protein
VDACGDGDPFLCCGGLGWGGLVLVYNSGEKMFFVFRVGIMVNNILGCRLKHKTGRPWHSKIKP